MVSVYQNRGKSASRACSSRADRGTIMTHLSYHERDSVRRRRGQHLPNVSSNLEVTGTCDKSYHPKGAMLCSEACYGNSRFCAKTIYESAYEHFSHIHHLLKSLLGEFHSRTQDFSKSVYRNFPKPIGTKFNAWKRKTRRSMVEWAFNTIL